MGIEESKLFPTLKGSPNYSNAFQEPTHNRNAEPWERVYQVPVHTWYKRKKSDLNFVHRKITCPTRVTSASSECSTSFCMTTQTLIELPKSGPFPLRKRAKMTKMAEHFEYNHIPAHVSSIQNFHLESVLCHRNALVVLHLSRNYISQFGAVDLHANKFLGVFGRQRADYASHSVAGELSPDEGLCMLRFTNVQNGAVGDTFFQLYDIRTHALLSEIRMSTSHNLFAFDPRFSHGRIVISDSFHAAATAEETNSRNIRRTPHTDQHLRELHFNQQQPHYPPVEPVPGVPLLPFVPNGARPHHPASRLADGADLVLWNCVSWQRLSGNMRPLMGLPPRQVAHSALKQLCYTPSGHLLIACYVEDRACRCALIESVSSSSPWQFLNSRRSSVIHSRSSNSSSANNGQGSSSSTSNTNPQSNPSGNNVGNSSTMNTARNVPSSSTVVAPFSVGSSTGLSASNSPSSSSARRSGTRSLSSSMSPSHEASTSVQYRGTPQHHSQQPVWPGAPSFVSFYQHGVGSNNSARSRRHFSVSAAPAAHYQGHQAHHNYNNQQHHPDNHGMATPSTSGHLLACRIIIFDSNAMHRLRMLEYTRLACPLHSCRVNFTPQFSRCGSRMMVVYNPAGGPSTTTNSSPETSGTGIASVGSVSPAAYSSANTSPILTSAGTGNNGEMSLTQGSTRVGSVSGIDFAVVFQMPPPLTLKAIARESLLQVYSDEQILRLPLPMEMIDFMLFRPPYSCAGSCISRSTSSLTSSHTLDFSVLGINEE